MRSFPLPNDSRFRTTELHPAKLGLAGPATAFASNRTHLSSRERSLA